MRRLLVDELQLCDIDTSWLENYGYIIDSLQTVYGESMREYLTDGFGFFGFFK